MPPDQQPPRFAADRTLMRLARWLRLTGADVICEPRLDSSRMLAKARLERRPLLSRDKRLRTASDVLFIASPSFRDQLREVLARYPFDLRRFAFTRCSRCNGRLVEVAREALRRRLPPFVYASHDRFALCPDCGRIYWDATHREHIADEIAALEL